MGLSLPLTPYYTQFTAGGAPPPQDEAGDPLGTYAVAAAIGAGFLVFVFESMLCLRQRNSYRKSGFPEELRAGIEVADLDGADARAAAKRAEESVPQWQNSWEAKVLRKEGDGAPRPTPNLATEQVAMEEDESMKRKEGPYDRSRPLLPQILEKFAVSRLYGCDKMNFLVLSSAYGAVEAAAFMLLGFFPYIWDGACTLGAGFGWTEADNEIKISLLFMAMTSSIGTVTSLPFEMHSTFRIEKRHGLSKATPGDFVLEKLQGAVFAVVIGAPGLALALRLIKWAGDSFYVYLYSLYVAFSLAWLLYPIVIVPMTNSYKALPEDDLKHAWLRDRISELTKKLNFPLKGLLTTDGSERGTSSYAYLFGSMGNKRIVLYDTMLNEIHDNELLALVGHELGHWKMGHTLITFITSQLYAGAAFYVFSLCYGNRPIFSAFGFDDPSRPTPTIIALLLFMTAVWEPLDKALSFATVLASRRRTFAADAFSAGLGYGRTLCGALCKVHVEDLGAVCPDPWYSAYHYPQPPLVERLRAVLKLEKEKKAE